MYRLTLIGDYVPAPACPWYVATAIYLPLGILMLILKALRTARGSCVIDPPAAPRA